MGGWSPQSAPPGPAGRAQILLHPPTEETGRSHIHYSPDQPLPAPSSSSHTLSVMSLFVFSPSSLSRAPTSYLSLPVLAPSRHRPQMAAVRSDSSPTPSPPFTPLPLPRPPFTPALPSPNPPPPRDCVVLHLDHAPLRRRQGKYTPTQPRVLRMQEQRCN